MKSFTLIELLIVMAVAAIILGLGYFIGFDFYKNYALRTENDVLTSILRKARSQAMNNIGGVSHGIQIGDSSYTIFYGDSYVSRDAQFDEIVKKSAGVGLSGLNEAVFQSLTAVSSASGTIVLSSGANSVYISVNYEGRIDN